MAGAWCGKEGQEGSHQSKKFELNSKCTRKSLAPLRRTGRLRLLCGRGGEDQVTVGAGSQGKSYGRETVVAGERVLAEEVEGKS